jgi:S1-C subfamily serine protease
MIIRVLVTGLAVIFTTMPPELSVGHAQEIGQQISALYANSTVFLVVRGTKGDSNVDTNLGTGFVIAKGGYVITAAHLYEDKQHIPYKSSTTIGKVGASFDVAASGPITDVQPLDYIDANYKIDIALLKLQTSSMPTSGYVPVRICAVTNPAEAQGERVYSLGFPFGLPISVNSGTLSSVDVRSRGMWKTDLLVNEGSSGGPVFDNSRNVIGVVKGGIQAPGNNFIVPINLAADLVKEGSASTDDCDDTVDNILHRL